MSIYQKLMKVQHEIKAPKSRQNTFGKYAYRSCEDIVSAVKPLLFENGLCLKLSDEIKLIGDRYYLEATALIYDVETGESTFSTASAREDESKKGMDLSQLTGATSSYARKYALSGLLGIDDNEDSDDTNKLGMDEKKISELKIKILNDMIKETRTDTVLFFEYFKIDKLEDMVEAQLEEAVRILEKKKGNKA